MTCLALAVFDAHRSVQVLQHTCLTYLSKQGGCLCMNAKPHYVLGLTCTDLTIGQFMLSFTQLAARSRLTPLTLGGCDLGADANDAAQFAELKTQGDLTRRAWERDVQVCPLDAKL